MPPKNETTENTSIGHDEKKRRRLGYTFLALCALSFMFSFYRLPFSLLAGVFSIGALIWGIRLFIACVKTKGPAPLLVFSVIGVVASVMSILAAVGTLVLYPIQKSLEECTTSAITQEASVACQTEYKQGVEELYKQITGQPLPS